MKKIKTNKGDIGLVILLIIALFILWYFVGGGKTNQTKPFMQAQNGEPIPAEVLNWLSFKYSK